MKSKCANPLVMLSAMAMMLMVSGVTVSGETGVSGQTQANSQMRLFGKQDADRNGFISKEEATGTLKDRYDEADTNKNGKIEYSEFSAFEIKSDGMKEGAGSGPESGAMKPAPAPAGESDK